MTQVKYPEFFNQAPVLRVQDKLAEFLGAAEHGIMEYRYADAVRLCLQALYGTELPQRGEIEVAMQGARDEGTVGVTAAVAQLLTGAAPETGFGGIGPRGRFSRRNLLSFDVGTDAALTLRRKDNGKTVAVSLNAGMSPFAPEMRELMPKAVGGTATPEELKRFGELWQARVKAFLLDLADDPQFVVVRAA